MESMSPEEAARRALARPCYPCGASPGELCRRTSAPRFVLHGSRIMGSQGGVVPTFDEYVSINSAAEAYYERIDRVLDCIAAANTPDALAEQARFAEAARKRRAERAARPPEWRRNRGVWSLPLYCAKCEPIVMTIRSPNFNPPEMPRLRVVHSGRVHTLVEQTPDGYWQPYRA